jgi:1,4-alpha-glucan branching enzyme
MMPLSHDEVVHGKKSLLGKMPGDSWQRFANLRLLYSYMIAQPGKKLLFMGGEIGQWDEWNHAEGLQWNLLQYPIHSGLHLCVKELNHLYQQHPALWEKDGNHHSFSWVDLQDHENSVISYLRLSQHEHLLCVHHFTPSYIENYSIPLRNVKEITEIFNSDATQYGGSGKTNPDVRIHHDRIEVRMPPLATMIFGVRF